VSGLAFLSACHGLLDVSDPTIVQDKDIANAAGANARRASVVANFSINIALSYPDIAVITDEQFQDIDAIPVPSYSNYLYDLDRRDSDALTRYAGTSGSDRHLAQLDETFAKSSIALTAMRAYGADSEKDEYLAQLFALRGFIILQMAEDMCPGFPINDVSPDNLPLYSGPYSYTAAVQYALAQLDSALVHGRDSTRFTHFARIVKGRALLDLGQYAVADTVVLPVPTSFTYKTEGAPTAGNIFCWGCNDYGYPTPVGNREGGNGIPFVSAQDPRLPTIFMGFGLTSPTDSVFDEGKYPDYTAPIVVASGTEARLIQAEAALHEPNPQKMIDILNALRTPAGLSTLSVPPTAAAQVDTLYTERAFWLYLTGRRLGGLRRLIKKYGRTPESVFPTGPLPLGDAYGTATAIPFTLAVQAKYNNKITQGCAEP